MTTHSCYRFSAPRHRTGAVALKPPFDEPLITMGVGYLPLLLKDLIILSFTAGRLAAFNQINGQERWTLSLSAPYEAALPFPGSALFNGTDLIVSDRDGLIIVDPDSGMVRERGEVREINVKNAAPMSDGLIAAYREGNSHRVGFFLSSSPARPVWSVSTALPIEPISVRDNFCCFAPTLDEVVALNSDNGAELWRFPVGELGMFTDDLGRTRKGEIASECILWKDLTIFGVRGNRVIALDVQSGQIRWNCPIEALTPSNLTLDASGVLHLLAPERYYRIEAATGDILTCFDVEEDIDKLSAFPLSHMDTSTTHVFCAGISGIVFAMAQVNGKVSWTYRAEVGAPFSHYPLVDNNCLYYLDGKGVLMTFPKG